MTEAEWLDCDDPQAMLEFLHDRVSDRKLRLFAVACCRRIWDLLTFQSGRRAVEVAEMYADGDVSEEERTSAFVAAAREAAMWVNNCSVVHNAIGYSTSAAAYVAADESTVDDEATSAGANEMVIMAHAIHHEITWDGPAMIVALDAAFAAGSAVVAFRDEQERVAEGEQEDYRDEEARTFAGGAAIAIAMGLGQSTPWPANNTTAFDLVQSAEAKKQCELLRCVLGNPIRACHALAPSLFAWHDKTIPKVAESIYRERAFDRLQILADALEEAGCDNADLLAHLRGPGPHVRGCWALDLILDRE